MNIDTGYTPVQAPDVPTGGAYFVDTVLLPATVAAVEPGYFTVFDGKAAVLTAYGLVDDQTLTIEKMLFTSGTTGGAGTCGCPATAGTTPTRVNAVQLCNFALAECTAIRIINVPGRYRIVDPLHLTDNDVIVTVSYMEKAAIPPHLLYGGS